MHYYRTRTVDAADRPRARPSARGREGEFMSYRRRFRTIAVIAAIAVLPFGAGAADRPNVVIFLADDLGWADVGYHGGQQIDTPSLDRLAREGTQLHRFYTTPICSPTRAALMTGRDPMRLGVAYAVIMPWRSNGIHPDEHFMPQSFLAAGYQTAMVGKWHLGHAQQTYHPNERGLRALLRPPPHRGRLLPSLLEPGRKGLPAQRRLDRRPGLRDLSAGRRGLALDPRAGPRASLLPLRPLHRAAHTPRCARRT